MGFITPRSFDNDEDSAAALLRCAELTGDRPCGVNLTLSNRPEANRAVTRWLDIALAHGVRLFETAGYAPTEVIGTLHAAGATVIRRWRWCSAAASATGARSPRCWRRAWTA